jgi:predicted acyl esterase
MFLMTGSVAGAAHVSRDIRYRATDSVEIATTVSGEGTLTRRPVIVEFSPYGRASGTLDVGSDYNYLLVQIRGTGDSDGTFDALGPRTQADVAEVLGWACRQPWSNGRLAVNGFSASAITIYNSLHLNLPCVRGAILGSGTHELYRDLLYPGGISNVGPGLVVEFGIGSPAIVQGPDRLGRDPTTGADTASGISGAGLEVIQHPTLDAWWRERGMRGDVNRIPTLMIDSFFDVESRGAFQAFQELRSNPSRLVLVHGHDGAPAGTDGGLAAAKGWLAHYVRGVANNVVRDPRVQMLLSDGDRVDYENGKFVRYDATTWPVKGTRWTPLALDAAKSGTANTINDGTLSLHRPAVPTMQSYSAVPSLPTATDLPNTGVIGAAGFNQFSTQFPTFTDMTLAEPLGLSYTTAPLKSDVLSVGPASLELRLSSTALHTGIWAVIADVSPDGTSHPVATGRLLSDYPGIDAAKSLKDPETGDIVQPYGNYSTMDPATIGMARTYRVELWPIGNRFKAGHRIRLDVLGTSAASKPGDPAVNTVTVGGPDGSRLLLPHLNVSDLPHALGAHARAPARPCTARRRFVIRLAQPRGVRLRSAVVTVAGRRVAVRRRGRRLVATIDLRRTTRVTVTVRITSRTVAGRVLRERRTYRTCRPGG